MRKSDLAQTIGKSPTVVAGWESGSKRPTASTVAELALGLGIDPGFFAVRQEDVAALTSTPHFRSLRATTQLARDQARAYGQLSVDIAASLERSEEHTTELQSLMRISYAAFCLQKKKHKYT